MTRPKLIPLGPFVGGLANAPGSVSLIQDNELRSCQNFNLDVDGSLAVRDPINVSSTPVAGIPGVSNFQIIGSGLGFTYFTGTVAGVTNLYSFDTVTYTLLRANFAPVACVMYANRVFFAPSNVAAIGGYTTNGTVFTLDANIPQGIQIFAYKQRLWVIGGQIGTQSLRFTEPINPAAPTPLTWTATNAVDVNPGDGETLWSAAIQNNNLLLFKTNSTYVFSYDITPADGAVQVLSKQVGTSQSAQSISTGLVAANESAIYTYHNGSFYEVVNYSFTKVSDRIKFPSVNIYFTTRYRDYILLSVQSNGFYVFNTRTRTWSTWTFADPTTGQPPGSYALQQTGFTSLLQFCAIGVVKIYTLDATQSFTENINASFQTKSYAFGAYPNWKRHSWWGLDAYCTDVMNLSCQIDNGFVAANNFTDATGINRKFYKSEAIFRFRNIAYTVNFTGNITGGANYRPKRVFNLFANVGIKELLPRKSNG